MTRKIIIWVLILLLTVGAVSAALTDGLQAYYKSDDAANYPDATGNNANGTIVGATYYANGLIGGAYGYDGINDKINIGKIYDVNTGDVSVSFWMVINATSGAMISNREDYAGTNNKFSVLFNANELQINAKDGGSDAFDSTHTISTGLWYHVVMTRSGANYTLYLNGTMDVNDPAMPNGDISANQDWMIGRNDGVGYFAGKIDEVAVWNRSITIQEVIELYNGGVGFQYPFSANLTVSATKYDTGAPLTGLNVTLTNSTINWTFTTAGSSVTTNVTGGTYNITVSNYLSFSNVTLNHNAASALSAALYQSDIIFTSRHAVTGANIAGVTYTSAGGRTGSRLFLDAGSQTVTADKTGYYAVAPTLTIAGRENTTREINLSTHIINVTAYNYTGGQIMTFDVTADYLNGSHTQTYSTTTGFIEVPALNGTWNITLDAAGYAVVSNTTTLTTNYTALNFTMVFTTNSVNITFYDEDTLALLNTINITADFISDAYANNYSTSTGWLYVDLLSPSTYHIEYTGSGGYDTRDYYFTLTNRTYNELTLYLGQASTNITITLYDQFNNLLEGYEIELLRYYVATNSFILVDNGVTNFEGVTKMRAILNDPYYKFRIYDTDGVLLKTTGSTQLYDTTINLFVNLGESVGELLDMLETVTYNLDFLPSSDRFRLVFTNLESTTVDAKIDVYVVTPTTETLNVTSSTSAASGTLYAAVSPINGTVYKAYAYIRYAGEADYSLVDVMTYSYTGIVNTFGMYGLLLSLIIVVAFIMIGVSNPTISTILVPVSLILTRIAGLHTLEWYIITSITVVAIIIIYLISDRS